MFTIDHLIELQLLDSVAQKSGLCNVVVALAAADPSKSKAVLLGPASGHISALQNLNFLEASVNNRVSDLIHFYRR
jgi:hypothetical protein